MIEINLGRKGFISLTRRSYPPLKEVSAGTEIEEPAYQLAPHGLLTLLPYMTQGHLQRGGTTHSMLDPLISVIKIKKEHPNTCLQDI